MHESGRERRKMWRFDLGVPAWVTLGECGNSKKLPVTTRDISAKGVFLFTDQPLKIGSSMNVCVVLPKGQMLQEEKVAVTFNGRVVRVESSGVAVLFNRKWEVVPVARGQEPCV